MNYKGYEITVEQDAVVLFDVNDDLFFDRCCINYMDGLTWCADNGSEGYQEWTLGELKQVIDELEGK